MRQIILMAITLLLGAALVWVAWFWSPGPRTEQGAGLAPAPSGGDFRLTSAFGPVDTRDLRGRVVLVYFGYTRCPDLCPTNLAFIGNALKSLSEDERARVQVLLVTLDPERDSPERLREYTAYFHPDILGLTGTPADIAAAAEAFGVGYRRAEQGDSALGSALDHSVSSYLIDADGRLMYSLRHATPPERIAALVRELLGTAVPSAHPYPIIQSAE